MKKHQFSSRLILTILLLFTVTAIASAGSQWDITLNVPYFVGVEAGDESAGEFSQYLFLVPDVQWHYYFGENPAIRFGLGMRLHSLIVESVLYPRISLESMLGNFVINAGVGGGLILFFGLYSDFVADAVILPSVSVAYRLGKKKQFSLGTEALMLFAPGISDSGDFAFIGTAFARWTL